MQKILFVSVGGSYQPIVKAIESLKPERTVFFCSTGSHSQVIGKGKPCEQRKGSEIVKKLPNIPTQLQMGRAIQSGPGCSGGPEPRRFPRVLRGA